MTPDGFVIQASIEMSTSQNIDEKRLDCLERLVEIQKTMIKTNEEYLFISFIEGKTHENAWARLGNLQNQYKDTFDRCRKTLDPKKEH